MQMSTNSMQEAAAGNLAGRLAATTSLAERIGSICGCVHGRIAFSTSLGLEDQAMLHAIAESGAAIDVFTLDTGRLFTETIDTLAASEERYGLKIRVLTPRPEDVEAVIARDGVLGFRHSIDARKACCHARKVLPLRRGLGGAAGWITGLRRGQTDVRSEVPFAVWDATFGLLKINPLADWSVEMLETYVAANDVPFNALHARGFASIGCQPCTRAVRPGEDIRAGRWWWESADTKECGLHANSKRKAVIA